MKKMILTSILATLMTLSAQARTVSERIEFAAQILAEFAEGSQTFKVTPKRDVKALLLEFAMQEKMIETTEEFEENWTADSGKAWGPDSMAFGTESLSGGEYYIESSLEQRLEESEQTDQDKIAYADGMMAKKRAFTILRSIKSVRFGVIPMGAVQCGVTFPSLVIIDTESGKLHQISMEGSGC